MTSSSVTHRLVEGYQSNTNYTFTFQLKDKAGNISQPVTRSFTAPILGIGGGGVAGDFSSIVFGEFKANGAYIDKNNVLHLKKLEIPAPIIHLIQTEYGTEKVNTKGTYLPKNHTFTLKTTVSKLGKSYDEAAKNCNASIPAKVKDFECMGRELGRSDFTDFNNTIVENCKKDSIFLLDSLLGNTKDCIKMLGF